MQQADFTNTFQDIVKKNGYQGVKTKQNLGQETEETTKQAPKQNSNKAALTPEPQKEPTNNQNPQPQPQVEFTPPEISKNPNNIDIEDAWKILYEKLKMNVSERDLNIWYKGLYLEKIENGVAELSSDNPMKKEWIENNHRGFIRNKLSEIIGYTPDLIITVRSSLNSSDKTAPATKENYQYIDPNTLNNKEQQDQGPMFTQGNSAQIQNPGNSPSGQGNNQTPNSYSTTGQGVNTGNGLSFQSHLSAKYTISNFVVGSNNQMAHAVAESIIHQPGAQYNPVFFYGPSGVGKTHLMQAIGNAMKTQNPLAHVIYVPIETFMNELIDGIRTGKQENFRQKYRAADLLIIDDIQFLSTYKKTQEEVFNTFNTLYQDGKQIVIASDRPPREIENLPDRLRTRFDGGMVVDIQIPDLETRVAILKQKVGEYKDANVPDNLLMFIAQNLESSVRELEGAITKVIAHQKFSPMPLTEDDIAKMLQVDLETKRKRIKPSTIFDAVCDVFDVTSREIKGKRRTAHIALSRQVIMYLLREELELPLERIAREVNRTDHTTVLHACNKIEGLLDSDERFVGRVDRVKSLFKG
jgi:chromosomal replication initiator protein